MNLFLGHYDYVPCGDLHFRGQTERRHRQIEPEAWNPQRRCQTGNNDIALQLAAAILNFWVVPVSIDCVSIGLLEMLDSKNRVLGAGIS